MCVLLMFVFVVVSFFFFLKTQRGSGSQESALERSLGPCVVARACVRACMLDVVLSVQCLPPPHP